ncbi:hypothetical protein RYX36_001600, partial [Vicia faba]
MSLLLEFSYLPSLKCGIINTRLLTKKFSLTISVASSKIFSAMQSKFLRFVKNLQ